MPGKTSQYPNQAPSFVSGDLFDVSKKISNTPTYQSQKFDWDLLRAYMLSENVQQIHYADLVILAAAAGMEPLKTYCVDDAVSGDKLLRVIAATTTVLYQSGFDLTSGDTGIYDLSTDKFFPLITSFKRVANQAAINAGAVLAIAGCGALPAGYAWDICGFPTCKMSGQTTAYNGLGKVTVGPQSNPGMFTDNYEILVSGDMHSQMLQSAALDGFLSDMVFESEGLYLRISSPSTLGDGTLTIYGTARIITL